MTWAITPGQPHGGALPLPQIDDIGVTTLFPGDTLVITGTGFTPGTQVVVQPGDKVIGESSPTDTTSISITVPYDLPNIRHLVYVTNGNPSNSSELFILRDVTISAAPNTVANVTVTGAN